MKMAIIIVLVIMALLIGAFAFFGGFSKVTLKTENVGGEVLVYEPVTGAYQQTTAISNKVYNDLLNNYHIQTTKGFGIFYDNPKNVEQSKLRSEVGCIVENADLETMQRLMENHQVKTLPNEHCLVAEFPFRDGFSIMIGMMKVHPKIGKYIAENNYEDGPMMEIYDVANKKIIYRKFLIKK